MKIPEWTQHFPEMHGLQIEHAMRLSPVLLLPGLPDESFQFRQLFGGQVRDGFFDLSERAHGGTMHAAARSVNGAARGAVQRRPSSQCEGINRAAHERRGRSLFQPSGWRDEGAPTLGIVSPAGPL